MYVVVVQVFGYLQWSFGGGVDVFDDMVQVMWCFSFGVELDGQFVVVGCWNGVGGEIQYFIVGGGGDVVGDVVQVEVVGVVWGQFDFDIGVWQVEVFDQCLVDWGIIGQFQQVGGIVVQVQFFG